MSWKKSKFASSLISLFTDTASDEQADERLETVRTAMQEALRGIEHSDELAMVIRRLVWAPHAQALWYLRTEVMTLLSGQHGELAARQQLNALADLFVGLLPPGQAARVSPLGRIVG